MSQNRGRHTVQRQTDEQPRVFDPIDHVRLRPGMYIGGTDAKALSTLFNEAIEYVIHQRRVNGVGTATVFFLGPQTLLIRDNSSVIDFRTVYETGRTYLHYMMTFVGVSNRDGALRHELGLERGQPLLPNMAFVNALCSQMCVEIRRDGGLWAQGYEKGHKVSELTYIRDLELNEEHGTTFIFTIDDEIFGDVVFDAAWIEERLFELACLLPNLNISFENRVTGQHRAFHESEGLEAYIAQMNRHERALHVPLILSLRSENQALPRRHAIPLEIEIALQFLTDAHACAKSFANGVEIIALGPHTNACLAALTDMLLMHSAIIQRSDIPHLLAHLRMVNSLWYLMPQFESMGERRLLNRDLAQPIYDGLCLLLTLHFKEHPETLEALEQLAASLR